MNPAEFSPGFRLSKVDVIVLIVGTCLTVVLGEITWWWGLVVGYVLAHFFLFCNFIRASRPLELAWSGFFIILASGTILFNVPDWTISIAASLCATIVVVWMELRKPSYHGIGWKRINPGLREWWNSQTGGAP
jgi:hypothetical protein